MGWFSCIIISSFSHSWQSESAVASHDSLYMYNNFCILNATLHFWILSKKIQFLLHFFQVGGMDLVLLCNLLHIKTLPRKVIILLSIFHLLHIVVSFNSVFGLVCIVFLDPNWINYIDLWQYSRQIRTTRMYLLGILFYFWGESMEHRP